MWRIGIAFAAASSATLLSEGPSRNIHIWGNGSYKPRPDHPEDAMNFSNFRPKPLKAQENSPLPDFATLSFGNLKAAGLNTEGKLYVWDRIQILANKQGADVARNIIPMEPDKTFKAIDFTSTGILFVLDSDGDIYQWRYEREEEPAMRKVSTAEKIVKINAGYDHFACIGESGKIYTMGDDTYGQCGVDSFNRAYSAPYMTIRYPKLSIVKIHKKAIDVQCGRHHTIALMEDNSVMVWGRNNMRQLGSISIRMGNAPAKVAWTPVDIETLYGKKVTKIAAGNKFSIFVTENQDKTSEFWAMGLNNFGQLGLGYTWHFTEIDKIADLSGFLAQENGNERPVGVKQLECGNEHCMALMDVGAVYIWGGNEHGEQGNQKRVVQKNPRLIRKYLKKDVKSIHCKQNNSAVIFE